MSELAARESMAAWDLRAAWATRAVVVLSLDPDVAVMARLAGYVERVSPTGATADLEPIGAPAESWEAGGLITVPCAAVLSVRKPHWHEPADAAALCAPRRERRLTVLDLYPDQLSFDEVMFP